MKHKNFGFRYDLREYNGSWLVTYQYGSTSNFNKIFPTFDDAQKFIQGMKDSFGENSLDKTTAK